ncbi:short neurotoxin 3-like [Solea solea]|uniref:short neurotoxin 3-like n=1 Tax=Solea solea TaxID=90069 RepID=UPI00272BC04D|nr:short neurotoxin 3-like [Solea solea]
MKILLLTLLVVLLCSTQVLTLQCYTCEDPDNPANTTPCVEECADGVFYCKTVVSENSLTRGCASECTNDENTGCCNVDLCDP